MNKATVETVTASGPRRERGTHARTAVVDHKEPTPLRLEVSDILTKRVEVKRVQYQRTVRVTEDPVDDDIRELVLDGAYGEGEVEVLLSRIRAKLGAPAAGARVARQLVSAIRGDLGGCSVDCDGRRLAIEALVAADEKLLPVVLVGLNAAVADTDERVQLAMLNSIEPLPLGWPDGVFDLIVKLAAAGETKRVRGLAKSMIPS